MVASYFSRLYKSVKRGHPTSSFKCRGHLANCSSDGVKHRGAASPCTISQMSDHITECSGSWYVNGIAHLISENIQQSLILVLKWLYQVL